MGEIIDKTKGRMKQTVGSLTGDEKLKLWLARTILLT